MYPAVTRVPHRTPVDMVQSYSISCPLNTHFRMATCAEVECPNHLHGFMVTSDESTDLGQQQAWYIRNRAGRRYTEARTGPVTVFTFEAGQRCFLAHPKSLERDPIFSTRPGDWRGYTGSLRVHKRPEDWVDDFANNQDRFRTLQQRG